MIVWSDRPGEHRSPKLTDTCDVSVVLGRTVAGSRDSRFMTTSSSELSRNVTIKFKL